MLIFTVDRLRKLRHYRNIEVNEFAKKLQEWRGDRLQKEAAEILRVPYRTYTGWEQGRLPKELVRSEIIRRMKEHKP